MPTGTPRVHVSKSAGSDDDNGSKPFMSREMMLQEFSSNIFRLMTGAGMSQSDLARKAKTGRDNISAYVRGKSLPRPKIAQNIAKALNCDINDLFPGLLERGVQDAVPSIELRQVPGRENRAWLRMNKEVSFSTAVKIVELVNQEDQAG
jgi:transcriptional regulator with XRE-family HTH domain